MRQSDLDLIHQAMNPRQYQMDKDYKLLKELEKKAEHSRYIPNSLDVETFDRVECGFISDYFNGSQDEYNKWRSNYD